MYPINDEKVLLESEDKRLALTMHRIRYSAPKIDGSEITSIMLEALASCAYTRIRYRSLLIIAGWLFVGGLFITASNTWLLAGIFLVAYLAINPWVMEFASARAAIRVRTGKMSVDAVEHFINQVEAAKDARYLLGRDAR
jgi:hypothetical protein